MEPLVVAWFSFFGGRTTELSGVVRAINSDATHFVVSVLDGSFERLSIKDVRLIDAKEFRRIRTNWKKRVRQSAITAKKRRAIQEKK